MKRENINLNRRLFWVTGLVFLLILCAHVSLEAQTYGNIWQNGNLVTHEEIFDVVFTGTRWVAVGSFARAYRSTDGKTWAKQSIPVLDPSKDGLFGIAHDSGNDRLVVVGRDKLIVSSDDQGVTWTLRKPKIVGVGDFYKVAFGNNMFLAVSEEGQIWKSTNGADWAQSVSLGVGSRHITFGNGWFLVATVPGKVYRSTDGNTWTAVYLGGNIKAIHYGNSKWVAVGNKIWTSSNNGASWTTQVTLVEYNIDLQLYCVTSAPGPSFIAGGDGGLMLNSADGITWRREDSKTKRMILGTTYGPGKSLVVAVGTGAPGGALLTYSTHYSPEGGTPGPVLEPPSGNTIRFTSPNGGEKLEAGTQCQIKWTGSITYDKIDIEYYNGSNWVVIVTGTQDDGVYTWTVPEVSTTKARLWMKGWHSSGNAVDYTDGTFTIIGEVAEITIKAPNGGEILTGGTTYNIKWQSSTTFDKVDIEYYNGSKWIVIKNGTEDDGNYPWTVPNISTTKARLWMKGWSDIGNPVDFTDSTFTITLAPSGSITVTSPNGGEVLAKNSTENITWNSSGDVGNVKISYSTNSGFDWNTITSSTANDGTHAWALPDIISDNCLVKINDVSDTRISDISNNEFSIGGPPAIVLNRDRFNFGHVINGTFSCPQTLFIWNGGGGTLNWTAEADASWINLNPASGSGGGSVTVSIDPGGLGAGNYTGTITISAPGVDNSPQTAAVYLTVMNSYQEKPPFGQFATPEDGTPGVTGSIGVTGWVLDDTCVQSVKINRQVNGELVYIGDAVFVEGARPDVEQAYPDYPNNYKAGWGYMMLTNFLPDGQLILKAIATDSTGHQVELGTKTIFLDNDNAVKPFGAIDNPAQGGDASGGNYRNSGWALTPQPNKIPENGSTINVYIDGEAVGKATYNLYREDIATLFPGYANTNGAQAYLDFDTTAYSNGVHTISWGVSDDGGNSDGIGSRYFTIWNTGGASTNGNAAHNMGRGLLRLPTEPILSPNILSHIPADDSTPQPLSFKTGYENIEPQGIYPDHNGVIHLKIREMERINIHLQGYHIGCMVVDGKPRLLPIGSKMDPKSGVFSWQPGPGFLGEFEFVFIGRNHRGNVVKRDIRVTIVPEY